VAAIRAARQSAHRINVAQIPHRIARLNQQHDRSHAGYQLLSKISIAIFAVSFKNFPH
jgi:hypothetical protein